MQDYRKLNEETIRDAYPLPRIPDLLDKLKGKKFFTKMDVRWGYNNVRIKHGDQWKAAFITKHGLFEPNVMFFGLCNSPATFQRMMDTLFAKEIAEGWLTIYMDDLLIMAETEDELREYTRRVLDILQENDLYLKPDKCAFNVTHVEYLGFIIEDGHLRMDPVKIAGIMDWPAPKTLKQLRSFLGFCNFYHKFIRNYTDKCRPLNELLQKATTWDWTTE